MKELTKEELQEIDSIKNRLDVLNDEKNKLNKRLRELNLQRINLPFKDKYIRYIDEFDSTPIYMKVDWINPDDKYGDRNMYSYTFKGLGFFGEFFGYDDATDFDWSYWFEFNIHGNYNSFKEKVSKIEIITKEEFDEAFEEMLKSLREYHYKVK